MATSDTGAIAAPLPTALSTSDPSRWSALPVLLAGAFMVVLDFFIVNVALPAIATDLGAGESSLEWVVAGYGLAFAAFLITAGRLGDLFGRRRVYMVGLGLFTLTSLACGLAPSPTALVIARVAQGASAAILMPQVLSTIAVTYRGDDHARALAIYGMVLGLGAVGGQLIGGALVQTDFLGLGWRGCFLINVPIGLAALLAAPRMVPESRDSASARARAAADRTSAARVVLAAGLSAVLLPLIQGREHGWPAWTWISLGAAPLILGAFVAWQARLGRARQAAAARPAAVSRAHGLGRAGDPARAGERAGGVLRLPGALPAAGAGAEPARGRARVHDPRRRLRGDLRARRRSWTAQYGRVVVAAGGATLAAGLVALALAVGLDRRRRLAAGAGAGAGAGRRRDRALLHPDPADGARRHRPGAGRGRRRGCSRPRSRSASRSGSRSPG